MACDVRVAAQSALFGQPEIKLGIIPGFGGTQRLPRLVGETKALEMNLVGDAIGAEEAYEFGLVNRVVVDHELLDAALAWARKLAGQAPLAVGADQGGLGAGPTSTTASRPRRPRFATRLRQRGRREGIGAFLGKRTADVARASEHQPRIETAWPRLGCREARSVVALTGAGISVPSGIPDFRSPGTGLWENVDPMEVAHIDAWRARPRALLALLRQRFQTLEGKQPNGAHLALAELEHARAASTRSSPRTSTCCTAGRARASSSRCTGRIESSSCLTCGARLPAGRGARAPGRGPAERARAATAASR